MLKQSYDAVMDPEINPLMRLPRVLRYQIMTYLSLMWSIVFSVWIGSMALFGPSMLVHTVLLVGVFITTEVFRRAPQMAPVDHRSLFRDPRDGCARYDDIWGGA